MTLSLEQLEAGEISRPDSPQMKGLHANEQFIGGSNSTHMTAPARRFQGLSSMSTSARHFFVQWCWNFRVVFDGLFNAYQSFTRNDSITTAAFRNNRGRNCQVHIQMPDDRSVSSMEALPVNEQNISSSSNHASPPDGDSEFVEPLLNRPRLTEAFLVIAAQVTLTLCTIESSSLSPTDIILLAIAMVLNMTGFVSCLYGILMFGRNPGSVAARTLTGLGYVAISYGLLAVMGIQFNNQYIKFWITGVTVIAYFPALAAAFFK